MMMSTERSATTNHDGASRLFIAMPIPAAVRYQMGDITGGRKVHRWPVKWVDPDLAHITVKFLGNTGNDLIPAIGRQLESVAGTFRPVNLRTDRCGAFPSLNRPQVLWLGVRGDVDAVAEMASSIDGAMSGLGFDPERRPFRPHITFGRVRRGEKLPADAGRIIGQVAVEPVSFTFDRLQLIQSVLGPGGPNYTTLAEWPLGSQVELVEHG